MDMIAQVRVVQNVRFSLDIPTRDEADEETVLAARSAAAQYAADLAARQFEGDDIVSVLVEEVREA